MKKSETIAKFRDEFLAGKSAKYQEKFQTKNENQQYIAIMNWKRKAQALGEATGDLAKVTMGNVVGHLKKAHKHLTSMATLSPREAAKVQKLLDSVKETIDNFDRVKKEQLLAALKAEKNKLAKQGSDIDRQIEMLQSELN